MVLDSWLNEVASVALDKSMVGISEATIQFKVFFDDEDLDDEEPPQAAKRAADAKTVAPTLKALVNFIIDFLLLHIFSWQRGPALKKRASPL